MIDDLWYKNGVFYCLSVGTYMDANADGIGDFRGYCAGWITCRGSASPRSG
jgi:hypothetical protein